MALKIMTRTAVSAGAILIAFAATAPSAFSPFAAAQAQTGVSVNFSFGTFYDRLAPYGSWVQYQDQYVFVPARLSPGWRPYVMGHWVFTARYGWLWVSSEPFGWATYHYGRWGYARDIGWYWVPGHRWAPAWVVWSRGHGHIAWAPLPPRYDDSVSVSIQIGDVPDYYWEAVPTSAFLSVNIFNVAIRDRTQVRDIVQQAPPQTVQVQNNIVVNNVVQVNEIEQATNTKVTPLTEKQVTSPTAAGKVDANSVAIFNADAKPQPDAKPKETVPVDQVIAKRKAAGIQPQDVPGDQPGTAPQTPDNKGNVQPVNPPADATQPKDQTPPPAVTPPKAETPPPAATPPKVETPPPAATPPKVENPPAATPPKVQEPPPVAKDQPANPPPAKPPEQQVKPKPNVPAEPNKKVVPGQEVPQANPPADKVPLPGDQAPGQNGAKKKGKDKPVACDPQVETCPPPQ